MINESTKTQLLETVDKLGKASVTDVVKNLPIKRSRQWVSVLLNELIKEGKLVSSKSGKYVYYVLPNRLDLIGKKIDKRFLNQSLSEDLIFDELSKEIPFVSELKEDAHSILGYAFTEMMNNAIEHSKSNVIDVMFEDLGSKVVFEVKDKGIGVFKNIMEKKRLSSEIEAIQELLKGKTTTLPHSHTGEGIFFTSKISDVFVLDSFSYRLRVDNEINDVFIEKPEEFIGTKVRFELNKNSNKHLNDIFYEFQAEPGSYSFDKTKVHVKLFKAGTVYISRSQARRLMVNLEKFKLIVLDYEGVESMGQAFADEVYRVFLSKHPNIKINSVNMSEPVNFMINRAKGAQLPLIQSEKAKHN